MSEAKRDPILFRQVAILTVLAHCFAIIATAYDPNRVLLIDQRDEDRIGASTCASNRLPSVMISVVSRMSCFSEKQEGSTKSHELTQNSFPS